MKYSAEAAEIFNRNLRKPNIHNKKAQITESCIYSNEDGERACQLLQVCSPHDNSIPIDLLKGLESK